MIYRILIDRDDLDEHVVGVRDTIGLGAIPGEYTTIADERIYAEYDAGPITYRRKSNIAPNHDWFPDEITFESRIARGTMCDDCRTGILAAVNPPNIAEIEEP